VPTAGRPGSRANRQQCRTVDAGCMADDRRGRQRVTGTTSGTGAIAPRRLPGDARSESLFAPCALWRVRSWSNRPRETPVQRVRAQRAHGGPEGSGPLAIVLLTRHCPVDRRRVWATTATRSHAVNWLRRTWARLRASGRLTGGQKKGCATVAAIDPAMIFGQRSRRRSPDPRLLKAS
jgi:hypothetical protein